MFKGETLISGIALGQYTSNGHALPSMLYSDTA